MEIRKNTRNTVTNTEGKQFTIKASAKAFRILSDGLYSDKITAIIRELSTNAYDAHVAAGNADQPFYVHLPTTYPKDECYFSIRDFGNSMTHDQVMELYTTYFGSDKTESNEFVGALGLGSKSPFSYTDSFTITAILDGDMRHYVAFMDQDGTPTISLMKQQKTTEPNGVEIKFAVEEQNCDAFADKARSVYRFFPVKPEVTGNSYYQHYNDREYIEADSWNLVHGERWNTSCYAIQGNIAYKIDAGHFSEGKAHLIATNNFHVQFDIGQLDVSASRESLSYDAETVKNIEARFSEVYDEFLNKINELISLEKSEYYAKVKARQIIEKLNGWSRIAPLYNGKELKSLDHYIILFETFPEVNVYEYYEHSTYRTSYVKRETLSKRGDRYGQYKQFGFPVRDDIIIVEDDGTKLKASKVRYLAQQTGKHVYLVEGASPRKFWSFIGKPDKIKLEKLDRPPRKPTVNPDGGKFYFRYTDQGLDTMNPLTKDELPKGEKFFVEVKSNSIIRRGNKTSISNLIKDLQMAPELDLLDPDVQVFGVMSREIKTKRFAKLGMIDLFDYLHKQTVDKVAAMKDDLDDYFRSSVKVQSVQRMSRISRELLNNQTLMEQIDNKNSKLYDIKTQILAINDEWKNLDAETSECKMLIEMAQRHGVEIVKPEFEYSVESIEAHYPMLSVMDRYAYNYNVKMIIDYINLVDSSKEK